MEIVELKKDLYRNKTIAYFQYYKSGKLYYKANLLGINYIFPVDVVENIMDTVSYEVDDGPVLSKTIVTTKLAADVGDGLFENEIKASLLIRWIEKAIKNYELRQV